MGKKKKPRFLFENAEGDIFPLVKLGKSDRVLISVDSQAASERVRSQIQEHYPDLENVIVVSNPDPDIVTVEVVDEKVVEERTPQEPLALAPTTTKVSGLRQKVSELSKPETTPARPTGRPPVPVR